MVNLPNMKNQKKNLLKNLNNHYNIFKNKLKGNIMEEPFDTLRKFTDVLVWLAQLSYSNDPLFAQVTQEATAKKSEHFKIPYDNVDNLLLERRYSYTKEEIPIIEFYHGYFRKTPAFRQWISK